MENIIHAAFGKNETVGNYRAEATSVGVRILRCNHEGVFEQVDLVPFTDVMRRLDAGEWEDEIKLSFDILKAWGKKPKDRNEAATDEELLLLWRWLIAMAFIREQHEKNGSARVEWRPGEFKDCALYIGKHGGMNLYPMAERLAMANNIEGALIERYGREQGVNNAIEFYMMMAGEDHGLSDAGREILADLHDSFIDQMNREGLPTAPTAH